ncbi:hypothetical protein BDN67DRAFT_908587, partial [Paxillus ammoniavirescens]
STHNTRIERMWVEVGKQFVRRWKAFFLRLERLHGLDQQNPTHLWLLHFLFLDAINEDAQRFIDEWNHHPLSTEKNQSPSDLRFLSEVENGIYVEDPYADIHPTLLARYHGVDDPESLPLHEDADELDEMRQTLEGEIATDMQANLNHEAITVAEHSSPFMSHDTETIFRQALADVQATGVIPDTIEFPVSGWDLSTYVTHEHITVGIRRSKFITLHLPATIWMPRAILWTQALHVLQHFLLAIE